MVSKPHDRHVAGHCEIAFSERSEHAHRRIVVRREQRRVSSAVRQGDRERRCRHTRTRRRLRHPSPRVDVHAKAAGRTAQGAGPRTAERARRGQQRKAPMAQFNDMTYRCGGRIREIHFHQPTLARRATGGRCRPASPLGPPRWRCAPLHHDQAIHLPLDHQVRSRGDEAGAPVVRRQQHVISRSAKRVRNGLGQRGSVPGKVGEQQTDRERPTSPQRLGEHIRAVAHAVGGGQNTRASDGRNGRRRSACVEHDRNRARRRGSTTLPESAASADRRSEGYSKRMGQLGVWPPEQHEPDASSRPPLVTDMVYVSWAFMGGPTRSPERRAGSRGEFLDLPRLQVAARELASLLFPLDTRPHAGRAAGTCIASIGRRAALAEVYRTVADDVHRGETISPAAEWLLDNFHLITNEVRTVHHDLPPGYYRRLPQAAGSGCEPVGGDGRRPDSAQRRPPRRRAAAGIPPGLSVGVAADDRRAVGLAERAQGRAHRARGGTRRGHSTQPGRECSRRRLSGDAGRVVVATARKSRRPRDQPVVHRSPAAAHPRVRAARRRGADGHRSSGWPFGR